MSSKNCGCDNSSSESKEYLMVKTTASEASTCAPRNTTSGTEGCDKQEPMFDFFEVGFVVPLPGSNITGKVCNASIYSVGQWIQTVSSPVTTLRIASISDNNLTLVNGCPNGAEIEENPDSGTAIIPGTRFSVVAAPDCLTQQQKADALAASFATAEEICVPALLESNSTAIVQVVGRIESDPGDLSFGKCIRRIASFVMDAGTPIWNAIASETAASRNSNRHLVIHKTTRKVKEIPSHSEQTGLVAGKQYAIAVTPSKESAVGPVWFPSFLATPNLLVQAPADINSSTSGWPLLDGTGQFTQAYSLNIADITSLIKDQDHYYAMCRIMIGNNYNGISQLTAYLNTILASQALSYYDSGTAVMSKNSVSIPIKVLTSDHTLTLRLQSSVAAASRYMVRLEIDGIYL